MHELIERRRTARKAGAKNEVKDSSKLLRKELRAVARATKTARIAHVLEEFKALAAHFRYPGKR